MRTVKEALYYNKLKDKKVQCLLCPQNCIIGPGRTGLCKVRGNQDGKLIAENYGEISAIHLDPVEKKPLYHFFPGRNILSIGTVGCNMHCLFCQNSEISQVGVKNAPGLTQQVSAEKMVDKALKTPVNRGIAYTYNEPVIWFEYIMEVAKLAHEKGLKNVMVSNGYINELPLRDLIDRVDAFNIDLKGFTDEFYETQTFSTLDPVKETIREISANGKHLEITNLIIPLLNDDPEVFEEMVQWLARETGKNTVLHLSRYFPGYKKMLPPTPVNKLVEFFYTARKYLNHVYIGNVGDVKEGRDTYCPHCKSVVIRRRGYQTEIMNLTSEGDCTVCGEKVINYI